jgi:hypothetical protein
MLFALSAVCLVCTLPPPKKIYIFIFRIAIIHFHLLKTVYSSYGINTSVLANPGTPRLCYLLQLCSANLDAFT